MSEKLVSIIIPVYKTEKYVYSCIKSALEQRYPAFEIILVDDGSPDNCPQLCEEYARMYGGISVIHQKNQGLGIARNTGLEAAKGEYVFFLDSDDKLDGPDAIACLVREAEQSDADITVGNYRKFMNEQIQDVNKHHLRGGDYQDTPEFRFDGFYRYGHLAYNWGKLYRRAFLLDNQLLCRAYPFTQDKAHNMLCYAYHPKYAFVDDSVYLYRINEESVTFRYKDNLMPVWISIASDFQENLKERQIEEDLFDLTDFHIFFGSFFLVKQELMAGKGIKGATKAVRKYAQDPFARKAMSELAAGKYLKGVTSFAWRLSIRCASILFWMHGYFLYTFSIAMLRGLHIDGKISDKRNKKKGRNSGEDAQRQALGNDVGCLCGFLSNAITGGKPREEYREMFRKADSATVIDLADRHRVLPMLYDEFEEFSNELAPQLRSKLEIAAEKTVKQSYRMLFLTRLLTSRLREHGIDVIVLKGSAVAAYFPVPEYRKSGDVDLLLRDASDVSKAGKILERMGYSVKEEQHANHHVAYGNEDGIDVELHAMLAEPFDNEKVNQRMIELQAKCFEGKKMITSMGVSLPVMQDSLQALELLLHMLQHFLRSGFGLKLLADWVVFWNNTSDQRAVEEFKEYAQECGVSGFAKAITLVCEKYLGLDRTKIYGDHLEEEFSKGYAEHFLYDIVKAEEFGKADPTRMVALRKRGFIGYIKEFHYQMKMNYPQESRKKWKWPVLWVKTFVVFLQNNKRLGRGSIRNILKSAGERAGVVEEMKLFTETE